MKKKNLLIFALVAVLVLAISSAALAKDVIYTLKGIITAIDDVGGTITIYNETDGFVTVFLPEGYPANTLAVGYTISVKGVYDADGFIAEEISIVSDILVGTITGLPVPYGDTGRFTITVEIEGGVSVTVLLPEGYPIETLAEGDTVRFKGTWEDGVFDAAMDGVCIEGMVTGLLELYDDTGRSAIVVDTDVIVLLPEGFDVNTVAEGDVVRACGTWVDVEPPDGTPDYLDATSVEINPVDEPDDEIEPGGRGGIYCDNGKEKPHPVAVKIAEMYADEGVTTDWVMEQFCAGFGFGEIMLALRTQAFLGEDALWDTRAILSMRNDMGWGQIWKALEISKSDKDDVPPPGHLNKPDKENNPPPGWVNKHEKGTPPGLMNKPEKVKGPKK